MADLEGAHWPTHPIESTRLTMRGMQARDRDGYQEMLRSEDVRRYLGGPVCPRDVERSLASVIRPGVFAVEADGEFVGAVIVHRREPERPGHVRPQGDEIEVSYMFRRAHWGKGYATEAVAAVLEWIVCRLPGEPVVLCTQSANLASVRLASRLGFEECKRFIEFDVEQWFGVLPSPHRD